MSPYHISSSASFLFRRIISSSWSSMRHRKEYPRFFVAYASRDSHSSALELLKGPEDLLQYTQEHPEMDTSSYVAACRSLGERMKGMCLDEKRILMGDKRLMRMLDRIASSLEDCNGRLLAMTAQSISRLRPIDPLRELTTSICEVAKRRENAFTPAELAILTESFGFLGHYDECWLEFSRLETTKFIEDFGPAELIRILRAWSAQRSIKRQMLDLVCDRLVDEIDRCTAKDVTHALSVLAHLGACRGFLLRRLSDLAFQNLHDFTDGQLCSIAQSLAQLRFLPRTHCVDLLEALKVKSWQDALVQADHAAKVLHALHVAAYTENPQVVHSIVSALQRSLTKEENQQGYLSPMQAVSTVHAFIYFKVASPLFKDLCDRIFSLPTTKTLGVGEDALWSIIRALETDFTDLQVEVPPHWKAHSEELSRSIMERQMKIRVHSEIALLLRELPGGFRRPFEENQVVGEHRVQFYDPESRVALETDGCPLHSPRYVKGRQLKRHGVRHVLIPYWSYRRCRSEEDQRTFLVDLLREPLEAAGILGVENLGQAENGHEELVVVDF